MFSSSCTLSVSLEAGSSLAAESVAVAYTSWRLIPITSLSLRRLFNRLTREMLN